MNNKFIKYIRLEGNSESTVRMRLETYLDQHPNVAKDWKDYKNLAIVKHPFSSKNSAIDYISHALSRDGIALACFVRPINREEEIDRLLWENDVIKEYLTKIEKTKTYLSRLQKIEKKVEKSLLRKLKASQKQFIECEECLSKLSVNYLNSLICPLCETPIVRPKISQKILTSKRKFNEEKLKLRNQLTIVQKEIERRLGIDSFWIIGIIKRH